MIHFIEPVTGFMLIDTLIAGEHGAFISALRHLILPSIVLGTIPLAVVARMTRSSMLEVLGEDYIRTAQAPRGLSPTGRVVWVHALRNALIPVVTVIGLASWAICCPVPSSPRRSFPGRVSASGSIESINRRDYPVLQGGVLLVACLIIFVNLSGRPALRR